MKRAILFFTHEFEQIALKILESGKSILVPGITFDAGIGMLFSCRGCDPNLLYAKIGTPEEYKEEKLEWMKLSEYKNEQQQIKSIEGTGAIFVEKQIFEEVMQNQGGILKFGVFHKGESEIEFMARIE